MALSHESLTTLTVDMKALTFWKSECDTHSDIGLVSQGRGSDFNTSKNSHEASFTRSHSSVSAVMTGNLGRPRLVFLSLSIERTPEPEFLQPDPVSIRSLEGTD